LYSDFLWRGLEPLDVLVCPKGAKAMLERPRI
jgi:hypothetical protein